MSANDGGDPVRLSREPVEKPTVRRGPEAWIRREDIRIIERSDDDMRATFTVDQSPFRLTYHDARMSSTRSSDWAFTVQSDVVVTWERISDASSQK
jgi:hypothetical protein